MKSDQTRDQPDPAALLAAALGREAESRVDRPECTCKGAAWCETWCPARPRVDRAYASPEEQDVLRAAEQALAGGTEKAPSVPVVSAGPDRCCDGAGQAAGSPGAAP